jgi:hypothetical protein
MDNAKKSFDYVLTKFFSSYLFLRNNDELKDHKDFPNIQKPFLNHLKRYYVML